jgi:hypothetical protein
MSLIRSKRQTIARVTPHQANRRWLVHGRAGLGLVGNNPELVGNGDFQTDVAGWSAYQGVNSWVAAGQARLTTNVSNSVGQFYQGYGAGYLVEGQRYHAKFRFASPDGLYLKCFLQGPAGARIVQSPDFNNTSPAEWETDFTAGASNIVGLEIFTLAVAAVRLDVFLVSIKKDGPE